MVNIIAAEHQRVSIVSIAFLSSNSSASMCVYRNDCVAACVSGYEPASCRHKNVYAPPFVPFLCLHRVRGALRGISGT